MDYLDIRAAQKARSQQNILDAFRGAVAIAGVTAGIFFVWLAFAIGMGVFLGVLSCVFGVAIAVACVSFGYLKR